MTMMLYTAIANTVTSTLLRTNEQRYMKFFRESYEAIVVADSRGVVREVNQSFADLFSSAKVGRANVYFI